MSDFRPKVEKWTFLRMRKKISPKLPEMTQAVFLRQRGFLVVFSNPNYPISVGHCRR